MPPSYRFLFNFAASYLAGGLKRLSEFSRWFDRNGGAWFIIHPSCRRLIDEYPRNRFFVADVPRYQRLFRDCAYLDAIKQEIGRPLLYYAYGIPMYAPVGHVNWFHLSNVLALDSGCVPLPAATRLKLRVLGRRILRGLPNAEVISAESRASLRFFEGPYSNRLVVSVNGSDDELEFLKTGSNAVKEDVATAVGTHRYKKLDDAYLVFSSLKARVPALRLIIIGPEDQIDAAVRTRADVMCTGTLPRAAVIEQLRRSRYYISTTRTENSFNAASEGIVFADESYISDIGPHRELLAASRFEEVHVPGVDIALLRVRREDVSAGPLRTWHDVVTEMNHHVRRVAGSGA